MATDDNTLTPTDTQVLQWLREGRLDAEIAVRLGISVGEAKEKIARLQARYGAKDREELARTGVAASASSDGHDWSRPREGEVRRPEEPGDEPRPVTETSGYSLRAVVMAAVGGVALAGAAIAGVAMMLSGGGEPAAEADSAMVTGTPSTASATSTPSVTATAHPGLSAIKEEPEETWSEYSYSANPEIDLPHGIFFMSPDDGTVAGYTVNGGPTDAWYSYYAGRNNRLIFGTNQERTYVYDRDTRLSYSWERDMLAVWAAVDNFVLLQETAPSSATNMDPASTGQFHLVIVGDDKGIGLVNSFELEVGSDFAIPWSMGNALMNDLATKAVLILWRDDERRQETVLVDLRSGSIRNLLEAEGWTRTPEMALGGNGFQILNTVPPQEKEPTREGYARSILYNWDGEILARLVESNAVGPERVEFSPNGQFAIAESTEAAGPPGLGQERWPLITLYEREADDSWRPAWRVKSATMVAGDALEGSHWLADSSGFVANVLDASREQPWQQVQAMFFPAWGLSLHPLPQLEVGEDDWWLQAPAIIPNPLAPHLFANNRSAVYNAESDRWFTIRLKDGPAHTPPWNGLGEMVITTPHGGHDGGYGAILLEPRFELPPFDTTGPVEMVVDGDGECLRVRSKPGTTGDIVDCLADGTAVTLASPEDWGLPSNTNEWPADHPFEGANVHYNSEDMIRFAYVRAGEVQGWVAMEFLAWPE